MIEEEENTHLVSGTVSAIVGRDRIGTLSPEEVKEIVNEKAEVIAEELSVRFSMDPDVIHEMSDGGGEFAYYLSALHYVERIADILKSTYIQSINPKMGTPDGNELSSIMADMTPPKQERVNHFVVLFLIYGFLKRDIAMKVSQAYYSPAMEVIYS